MSSTLLLSSLGALATGPLIARLVRARPQMLAFIDGFVLVSIGGLVLLDVVPHALEHRDLIAALCMAVGFALPTIAEKLFHYGVRQTHTAVLVLAIIGLALHSALDGSAIAQSDQGGASLLGYGVLLHQIPVSLMIWWVLSDRPRLVAWAVLAFMAVTTIAGYMAEPTLLGILPERAGLWFEGLVGGSLLHVIAHPAHDHDHGHALDPMHPHEHSHEHSHEHGHDHAHGHAHARAHGHAHAPQAHSPAPRPADDEHLHPREPWPNGVGALLGVALLVTLYLSRRDASGMVPLAETWATFRELALDSAPAVLLAYISAGLLHAFMPVGSLSWMSRGSPVRQGLAGMAVGLPIPVCSCGVVPLYQQLVQQGASTTAAVAFLVATPELGIDAILLSVPLMGTKFTILRVVAAAVAALGVALLVGRRVQKRARGLPLAAANVSTPATLTTRLTQAANTGFGEVVDNTAPWILAGLLLAAVAAPILQGSWLTRLPAGVDVVTFAIIGLPLYICASGSTPLVAVLVAAGVSPGAGLALLLTGPATNVSTIGILTRMHGRPFALAFAGAMIGMAVVLGWTVNVLFPGLAATQPPISGEESGTTFQMVSLLLVTALYAASVIRRGARGFLGELRFAEG
jgi:uncharacterized protein